jgi:DNA-binding NarL/FixJ family response regulator
MVVSTTPNEPRIVVVEDDPVLLSLLNELLTAEGYQVFPHSTAADAHLLVRNVRPQVVVLDLRLAGETETDSEFDASGWRVLDRLVLDPGTRDIPVVLASGAVQSIEAHRAALLPQHGVRVLLKPYDLDQLLGLLGEVVRPSPAEVPPDGAGSDADQLTPRQREIARLVALGYTNAQIALRLVVECGTVANHVAHIIHRLGVANRAQVAVWATRHGLVEGPRPTQHAHVA